MYPRRVEGVIALAVVVLMLTVFTGSAIAQDGGEPPDWEYEGENGPEAWGRLRPDYELCGTGDAQSPVDIPIDDIVFVDEADFSVVEADYQPSAINIVNNGHTIQFNYDEGSTLTIDDVVYHLLQFHFHIPSEHTIDGEHYPMEMHLVHQNDDGNLAVLGILMNVDDEEASRAFDLIWSDLPAEEGEYTVEGEVNAADFLPEILQILTYPGSLTTPPCTEGVTWMLSGEELFVDQHIVDDFGAIFEFNNRPVQPLNSRLLTVKN